jgi:glutamyl-tRNA reductase
MRPRRHRPLFIIDIALPRDVEAATGALEQVFLYNIDDLQATVRENLARRTGEVQHAETIVGEEVERFGAWLRSRGAIPTVIALRQHFESIRRSELNRLAATLPPDTRQRVDDISRLLIEKLLLSPTEQLKSAADAETVAMFSDALTRLFGLSTSSSEQTSTDTSEHDTVHRRIEPFVRRHIKG